MNNLYRQESSNPKWNAQRNLSGRSHYVDDDTLRFHHSRILSTHITDGGLLFALVESYAVDMNNTQRKYRGVILDVFGNVVNRPKLEYGFSSSKAATKAMWEILNGLDAKALTVKAIEQAEKYHAMDMADLRAKVLTVTKAV